MSGGSLKNSLKTLFERGERFPVDVKHLMEGIWQVYSFEKEKIPIVENVDNFIDERGYHTISFHIEKGKLSIEMRGSGIPREVFESLATIAFTSKLDDVLREKKKGLGYFGWGLKATMIVANRIEIETKCKDYKGRQVWFWKEGEPYREFQVPTLDLEEDSTVISYELKEEFYDKLNEQRIVETLQEFYPTLLAGAPALGKKRKFLVNNKRVPPPAWLDKSKYEDIVTLKKLRIDGETIGGRIFISREELPEELRGIAIIVCGRNVTIDKRENPYPEVKRYTGYVHADFFYKDLVGDKTHIKKRGNMRWIKFKRILANELGKVLREKGLITKTTMKERELLRKVNKLIARILEQIPELEKYGVITGPGLGRRATFFKGDEVPVDKAEAETSKTDIPHKDHEKGVDQLGWGEKRPAIIPSEKGKERARRELRKRRGVLQFILANLPSNVEARYDPGGGVVLVNKGHPTYESVKTSETARYYHVCRAGLESLIEYLLMERTIDIEEYLKLKNEILYTLGSEL